MSAVSNSLGLDDAKDLLRSGQVHMTVAWIALAVALVCEVVFWHHHDEPAAVAATPAGYLAIGCDLNDKAAGAELDGVDGPHSTSLMAEAQLLTAAGRTGSDGGATGFGNRLALTVQRQDGSALSGLIQQIAATCKGRDRIPATPANLADLTCKAGADIAEKAPTPARLGSPQNSGWAELRATRYAAAAAATGDKSYTSLADPATELYLAAAQPDPERYAAALTAVDKACRD